MADILAFDTSVGPCTVALLRDGQIVAHEIELGTTLQAQRLLPMIESALDKANSGYEKLAAIATTLGPGSFTGIRVALAAARGFHLASRIPLVGLTTLEVLAYGARQEAETAGYNHVLAALNAGRGQVYAQWFSLDNGLNALNGPQMLDPVALLDIVQQPCVIAGNISPLVQQTLAADGFKTVLSAVTYPDAAYLAELAATKSASALSDMHPVYIRPPDAKLPSLTRI